MNKIILIFLLGVILQDCTQRQACYKFAEVNKTEAKYLPNHCIIRHPKGAWLTKKTYEKSIILRLHR